MGGIVDRFFDPSIAAPEAVNELRAKPPGIEPLIERLKKKYRARITGELVLPAKAASFADLPSDLDSRLASALRARGIDRLYSHQREAWETIRSGRHTVVVTPTASGKTLCYNLPVLQSALESRRRRSISFPPRRCPRIRWRRLLELNEAGNLGVRAYTFDGDTPGDARKRGAHARAMSSSRIPTCCTRHPAAPHQVGAVLREPEIRRHRRDAYLPRRVRLAHGERDPAAEAHLPLLRREADLHVLLGDDRESAGAGRAVASAKHVTAITQSGAPQGREASAALEPAGAERRSRAARIGPLADHAHRPRCHQGGAEDHRLRAIRG